MVGHACALSVLMMHGIWGGKLVVVKARLLKSKKILSFYSRERHISELASSVQVLEQPHFQTHK